MKPIKGEEWIEEFREREFWIGKRRSYPQKLYSRITKSYVGWWFYLRLNRSRVSLLIDPLSCGGLWSHIRTFLFNAVVVDIWWRLKHRVWRTFHRKEWQQRCEFMDACMQATMEGFDDPMPPPPRFEGMKFHGSILGERYFKRVAELLREKGNTRP